MLSFDKIVWVGIIGRGAGGWAFYLFQINCIHNAIDISIIIITRSSQLCLMFLPLTDAVLLYAEMK